MINDACALQRLSAIVHRLAFAQLDGFHEIAPLVLKYPELLEAAVDMFFRAKTGQVNMAAIADSARRQYEKEYPRDKQVG